MKKLFNFLLIFIILIMASVQAEAKKSCAASQIKKVIEKSSLSETSEIAVSIKEVKTGNVIYEKNANKLLHPASTLKVFTTAAAIDTLGTDYNFKTQIYVDKDKNLYIKLGADPMLTSKDIKYAIKSLREKDLKVVNHIYIDDSILDSAEWGTGWMWDDGVNPLMPKFSAYNIDGNLLKINVSLSKDGKSVIAKPVFDYPIAIVNAIKPGVGNRIVMDRHNWKSPNIVELKGTVAAPTTLNLPVNNVRRYFLNRLTNYLTRYNIKHKNNNFKSALVPKDAKIVAEISHNIKGLLPAILQNSNNRAAETVFKVAGSEFAHSTGTNQAAVAMFNDFYNKNKVETKGLCVVDGSGVSRNDLISVSWMADALNKIYCLDSVASIKKYMAKSGDGTLSNRFMDLRGNVWLKTGTLANISAITGYVIGKDNKTYSVAIMIQNFTQPQSEAKKLEDNIIYGLYNLKK